MHYDMHAFQTQVGGIKIYTYNIKHWHCFIFPYMQAQRDDIAKLKEDMAKLVQALTPSGGN